MKNEADSLFQINPATGTLIGAPVTQDFPGQTVFGYLHTIDGLGRRYMYITRTSATSWTDFGLKIIHLDSLTTTTIPLDGYQAVSPGVGQFSFHGMEYGVLSDQVYIAPISAMSAGDSLYQVDMTTGLVSPVQQIPGFSNTYSYLHTFWQSEQRYAMIASDTAGQKRLFQVDLDDDTTYVSGPLTFGEPLRAMEFSETTGMYYVVSDMDQTLYSIDPATGTMTALYVIPDYAFAFGYLHTFDFSTDRYLFVGSDNDPAPNDSLSLFSIQPSTSTTQRIGFPFPEAGFFGLEATNSLFIARLMDSLNTTTTAVQQELQALDVSFFPNPLTATSKIRFEKPEPVRLQLLSMEGKILQSMSYPATQEISLGEWTQLAAGIYRIQLTGLLSQRVWGTSVRVD